MKFARKKAPNFLVGYSLAVQKKPFSCLGVLVFLCVTLVLMMFSDTFTLATALLALLIALIVFSIRLDWAVYAVASLCFFHGLEIVLGDFGFLRTFDFLSDINAPLVSFVASLTIGAFLISWFLDVYEFDFRRLRFISSGMVIYGLFLLGALISALFFMYGNRVSFGLSYLVYPMFFVFAAYVMLPVLLIDSRDKLMKILNIWFWVGLAVALFGFSSLFVLDFTGWTRVTPYYIFGVAPLGTNHNLIGEVLSVIVPIGLYFFYYAKTKEKKMFYGLGTLFIMVISFLTLSRAAWIVIVFQLLLYYLYTGRGINRNYLKRINFKAVGLLLLPLVFYMIFFLGSGVVSGSTDTRLDLTRIGLFYFAQSPLFGNGPGSYLPIIGDTLIFAVEYGEPMDSHGFVQKILTEEGAVGLMLFSAFVYWLARTMWLVYKKVHLDKFLAYTLFMVATSAIVFQLFNTSYFNSVMWMPIGVSLAGVSLIAARNRVSDYFLKK